MMLSIPRITAIVVTYNEERWLEQCLSSLAFCDELLVFDLGSDDTSPAIAARCGAVVQQVAWVPVVEQLWPSVVPLARHDWILRADPDEVFPVQLAEEVLKIIHQDNSVGMVRLPHQYYFLGRPLHSTVWGGCRYISKLFHRYRVDIRPFVHQGLAIKEGFEITSITGTPVNSIQHYWVDSWSQLFQKHWRYLRQEGAARYARGESFTWRRLLREPVAALKNNLIARRGITGGIDGIFLSFFYSWYLAMSLLSLRTYQLQLTSGALKNDP